MSCKREFTQSIAILASVLSMAGCTLTRSVSQTNIPAERGKTVEAVVERMIILGLVFDNDDVPQLTKKLQDKCPGGAVRGIMTKDLTTHYFLTFVMERRTIAKGYCVTERMAEEGDGQGVRSAALESEVSL